MSTLLSQVQTILRQHPPAGVSAVYVDAFFDRNREAMLAILQRLLPKPSFQDLRRKILKLAGITEAVATLQQEVADGFIPSMPNAKIIVRGLFRALGHDPVLVGKTWADLGRVEIRMKAPDSPGLADADDLLADTILALNLPKLSYSVHGGITSSDSRDQIRRNPMPALERFIEATKAGRGDEPPKPGPKATRAQFQARWNWLMQQRDRFMAPLNGAALNTIWTEMDELEERMRRT